MPSPVPVSVLVSAPSNTLKAVGSLEIISKPSIKVASCGGRLVAYDTLTFLSTITRFLMATASFT